MLLVCGFSDPSESGVSGGVIKVANAQKKKKKNNKKRKRNKEVEL